jgi:glutaredoxin
MAGARGQAEKHGRRLTARRFVVRWTRFAMLAMLAMALLSLFGACKEQSRGEGGEAAETTAPAPKLEALELGDDTKNLLLTWVDDGGDFHVVQKVLDVPDAGKKAVRVVVTDKKAGTGESVYVADLTRKRADGTYSVETMSRSEWEEVGASRRKARLEALAPKPVASGSAAAAPGQAPPRVAPSPGMKPPATNMVAIIYGAEWCKPCHEAAAYLRQRGVTVVEKDIDESDVARAEMQQKLTRANMSGAQIPIIDIGGQLLVGYSPHALDRALQRASGTQTL